MRKMHWCFENIIIRNVKKVNIEWIDSSRLKTMNSTQFHENLFAFICVMVKTKANQFVDIIVLNFQCEDTKFKSLNDLCLDYNFERWSCFRVSFTCLNPPNMIIIWILHNLSSNFLWECMFTESIVQYTN